MSRPFDTYDGLAFAQILLYTVFLAGAVLLCLRHGFYKSAGWRYLLALAIARLLGSSLRLATLSAPTNPRLYTGWLVLSGLGLGPLLLALLGLLSRAFDSMRRRSGRDVVPATLHRAIQALMLVAVLLLVIGGCSASFTTGTAPQITYTALSRVGEGLVIAVFALLCIETALAVANRGYVARGEHRVVFAVVACLPFVLVRLVYGALLVLAGVRATAWRMAALEVLMEAAVVLICEALGFLLAPPPPPEDANKPVVEEEARPVLVPAYGNASPPPQYECAMGQYPEQSTVRKTRRERRRERRERRWV